MKAINIKSMTMKELVTLHNQNTDKPVKRFSDRDAAERRTSKVVMEAKGNGTFVEPAEEVDWENAGILPIEKYDGLHNINFECPHCGINLENGVFVDSDVNGEWVTTDEKEYQCMACGGEFGKVIHKRANKATCNSISEGVRKSWLVPETAAKRSQRSNVEVDGKWFPSVRQAFISLDLPLNKHIKFRMELKEKSVMAAFGHDWVIIPAGE